LEKIIFACHGSPEFKKIKHDYPIAPLYTVTSDTVIKLFPSTISSNVLPTYNGVELEDFNYIERDGRLNKIGWCGDNNKQLKRANWAISIATKTNLLFSMATKLSYEKVKTWYNEIDVLLINSGPEEWRETGPLPAFEAIASGALVLGTRVGNFSKIPGPKYETIEEAVQIINDLHLCTFKTPILEDKKYAKM
jgi:hypothetical protein